MKQKNSQFGHCRSAVLASPLAAASVSHAAVRVLTPLTAVGGQESNLAAAFRRPISATELSTRRDHASGLQSVEVLGRNVELTGMIYGDKHTQCVSEGVVTIRPR